MTHPWFADAARPRVLAHRGLVPAHDGGAAEVAENSLAALVHAHAAGATYVESDCHVTADGVVVLFHDEDLARVVGDPRRVQDVTEHELDTLMADRGGLVTLQHALEAFPDLRLNLDVKAAGAAVPAGRLCAPHADRVLLTSFSDSRRRAALAAAREAGGTPATSAGSRTLGRVLAAVAARSVRAAAAALRGLDALQVPERRGALRVLSPRLLAAAHANGVEVHVWTINETADMVRLVELGVDGIVTDRADVALRMLATG
ncbi:glycerophosphodiester phosphodiesterase [Microbacterium sp. LRZ72]|uniref:glycerophosphodiester phosphodiesterase family protein n=1 Tax=Microbacterium sp. LRZ72 TaxID=2942481 RepID=UPI0029A75C30|nr:glycerophosphodiester phosphodiesterase family protein [Microbacterium sp. LRZ72]MDX2375313.1 glycerophosphodiester phosphodiesterase [Microbacterium sp. LRZ72]